MSKIAPLYWNHDRPLVFFDLETTGVNVNTDRIVSIACQKVHRGQYKSLYLEINPGMIIPDEAIAVHGITNEKVATCPHFPEVAPMIWDFMSGCDIAGYNILEFDVPLLQEEFHRCKQNFPDWGAHYIDVMKIFKLKEPRDLTNALRFYCQGEAENAHNAEADVATTMKVMAGMLAMYDDLPTSGAGAFQDFCNRGLPLVDLAGKLYLDEKGYVCYNFGKAKGKRCIDDRGFGDWMIAQPTFSRDTKNKVREALGYIKLQPQ